MRLRDAKGRTSLPLDKVGAYLRDEDVVTVLPVSGDGVRRDSLLVATPRRLAVVTGEAGPKSEGWMTQWAPWDAIVIGAGAGPAEPALEESPNDEIEVHIGGRTFQAPVHDATGREALHDFIVALEARRIALALPR